MYNMLDHQTKPSTSPAVPVPPAPPPRRSTAEVQKQSWLSASGGGGNKSNGFIVYLSNIPEKATSANLLGALRKLLGPFRPRNLLKIIYGSCKVVLEDKLTRDRLLKEPFDIFGTIIKTSLEPTNPGEAWPSVYIGGLPPQTTVGQLLGAIRKTIGEFQASNKLVISNGFSMIRFKTEQQQMSLLTSGLSICQVPVMLSKHPFPGFGSGFGMNTGFGQYGQQGSLFMQRRRVGAGFNGQGGGFNGQGVVFNGQGQIPPPPPPPPIGFSGPQQVPSMSVDVLELINNRLKSRVRYLEEQIAMYEERFAKMQAPAPGAVGVGAYDPNLW
jgi:hypothetical protein